MGLKPRDRALSTYSRLKPGVIETVLFPDKYRMADINNRRLQPVEVNQ